MQIVNLVDEIATLEYGQRFATQLTPGDIVFLHGNLGAGKTTLVRGILQGLGFHANVKSPTFTLVEPYELAMPIYHFDLYRLKSPAELDDIGFRDYCQPDSICLIEWPENAAGYLPKPTWQLTLRIHNEQRLLTID